VTCSYCAYLEGQLERARDELLQARLEVADGPRRRVRELEGHLEQANRTIAELNARLGRKRSA
jgi:hypothetical protein